MIKKFEEYINEDYFSKLASRKDNGDVRKENEITEDLIRSFVYPGFEKRIKSITIRKENYKTVVDIDGSFYLSVGVKEIPFQFGTVTGEFNCQDCWLLTSLEGCPQKVGGNFSCNGCKSLTSLEGCPQKVDYNFSCMCCGKLFTENEVKSLCKVKGKIYV